MKESIYNKRGTRQLVDSGWKLFDRQTTLLSTGNVIAGTQVSSFIRPWRQRECGGRVNPKGHLTNFDMKPFRHFRVPGHIETVINDRNRSDSVILYMFFVRKDDSVRPFGWALTTRNHELITSGVQRKSGENFQKRYKALKEAIAYVSC